MKYARIVSASAIACALGLSQVVGCSDSTSNFSSSSGDVPDATNDNSVQPQQDSGPTCASPRTVCSGNCVDTTKDVSNCGACGTTCGTGEVCSAGKCATSCGGDSTKCSVGGKDVCVNAQTDNENCGTCGTKCAAGSMCSAGKCAITCTTGYNACTSLPSAGDAGADGGDAAVSDAAAADAGAFQPYCANFKTDSLNCGTCGTKCGAGTTCQNGGCCGAGLNFCGAACTNMRGDEANCGACGTTCSGGTPVCVAGACGTCPVGTAQTASGCQQVTNVAIGNMTRKNIPGGTCNNGIEFIDANGFFEYDWSAPTGSVPSALKIGTSLAWNCGQQRTVTVRLNGSVIGTYVPPQQSAGTCTCAIGTVTPMEFTLNSTQLAGVLPGAINTIRITSSGDWTSSVPNAAYGTNGIIQITADY